VQFEVAGADPDPLADPAIPQPGLLLRVRATARYPDGDQDRKEREAARGRCKDTHGERLAAPESASSSSHRLLDGAGRLRRTLRNGSSEGSVDSSGMSGSTCIVTAVSR
jgi:hypothetical protein